MRPLLDTGVLLKLLSADQNERNVVCTLMDERPFIASYSCLTATETLLSQGSLNPQEVADFLKLLHLKAEVLQEPPSVLEMAIAIITESGLPLSSAYVVAAAMHCGTERVFAITGTPPIKLGFITVEDPFIAGQSSRVS